MESPSLSLLIVSGEAAARLVRTGPTGTFFLVELKEGTICTWPGSSGYGWHGDEHPNELMSIDSTEMKGDKIQHGTLMDILHGGGIKPIIS